MIPTNSWVYLETSAINFLADKYSYGDGRATHIYHLEKGTRFHLSNVSIWEILLTSDKQRREKLIRYIQNIGHPRLLKSPSEIIVHYIRKEYPIHEEKHDFYSNLDLASTWEDICQNRNKTFIFKQEELKSISKMIRKSFKMAGRGIENLSTRQSNQTISPLEDILVKGLKRLKLINYSQQSEERQKITKLTLLLIFFIFCNEITLDSQPIKKFWLEKGIDDIFERFQFVIEEMELLILRGPFPVLAEMAFAQMKEGVKATRGIYWDILHSTYLIYSDIFMTNDGHFKTLREQNDHLVFQKVLHMDEVKWFTAK